jgi:glycosyltransferase involved in cell wall biosynthesis
MRQPTAIHQFANSATFGDGVTNSMLFIRRLLRRWGIPSEIYCYHLSHELKGDIRPIADFQDHPEQILLIHHATGTDRARFLTPLSSRRILIYHNITPAHYFPNGSSARHDVELGRQQLKDWAVGVFVGAIGVSSFNAKELRANGYRPVVTIPLLVDLDTIRSAEWNRGLAGRLAECRNILFVGRIVDHKCQDDVIEIYARLRELIDEPVRLILVGEAAPGYLAKLKQLVRARNVEDGVTFAGKVSGPNLYAIYHAAEAFVCMSEHEGFGMPLVEAMAFDVPVIAYDSSAVAETMGAGGVILRQKDHAVAAGIIKTILTEPALRRRILRAQRANIAKYEPARLMHALARFLRQLGFEVPIEDSPPASDAAAYQIQGPFDSSDSLSVVNRELVRALRDEKVNVSLYSTDGPSVYDPAPAFLRSHPDIERIWRKSEEARHPEIVLRNLYPPRARDLRGVVRGLTNFAFEESGFPAEAVAEINRNLDVVLVTSRFVAKTLRDNGVRAPIAVVGNGADHILRVARKQRTWDLPPGFRFLHVSSAFARKGVDVLLEAWARAFSDADKVCLVVKTSPHPLNEVSDLIADLDRRHPTYAPIAVIDEDLGLSELAALYDACDALVAPSRGEGFGLPLAEAMLLEKPVITTAYGGQSDFCTPQTAWLVDYRFAFSRSHLHLPSSVWAEPDVDNLADQLRAVFKATHEERKRRTDTARKTILDRFTWRAVARQVRTAVDELDRTGLERQLAKPKVGWVSTWNSRCGIATYSMALTRSVPAGGLRVFANVNATPLRADEPWVTRCWEAGWSDDLEGLYSSIDRADLDAVVVQFNFGFFNLERLARLIDRLADGGKRTYVFLHSTKDVEMPGARIVLGDAVAQLRRADRVLVHSVHDLNRLKDLGLVDNVTLFPHGVARPVAIERNRLMASSDLSGKTILATSGFLLPHKGLRELIAAFAILRREDSNLHLLMVNALYPTPESASELAACKLAIAAAGLERAVTLITDFLPEPEILALLSLADLVVYPYQHSQASASGAIRLGLSSMRPVACSPLAIFDDVATVTHRLPGVTPDAIATGIRSLIDSPEQLRAVATPQRAWLEAHDWTRLSRRLYGLIRGQSLAG